MSDKLTRKELKAPDAFQRTGAEAASWLESHSKTVIGAVIALLVLSGGVALASYFSGRSDAEAAKAFGEAIKVLDRPVEEAGPSFDRPASALPAFKSAKEKDEAIVKSLTEFRGAHRGTPSAASAVLVVAQAELRLGNYDQAIASANEFLRAAPNEEPLRASALETLGYAHEGKGELDKALEAYERLNKDAPKDFYTGMGVYHRARVLALQGKKEEAAKAFSDLAAQHPNTAAARMANDRLAILAAEGVKVPAPAPADSAAKPNEAG